MAQETKVGLLIGLALILLVGLVLSDLFTGGAPESAEASSVATEFGREAQASIYAEPENSHALPSVRRDAFDRLPGFAAEPALDYSRPPGFASPPVESWSPPATPIKPASPSLPELTVEPPLPELDTLEARDVVTRFNDSLEAMRLAVQNPIEVQRDRDALPTRIQPAASVTPTPVTPVVPTGGTTYIHYVQAGQTLSEIARQHYGNPEFAAAIAQTNPTKVDREGQVRPGARLEIPPLGSPVFSRLFMPVHDEHAARIDVSIPALPGRPAGPTAVAPHNDSLQEIEVQPGDTLSQLASDHLGSSKLWKALIDANTDRLSSAEDLRSGMKLRIPQGFAVQPQSETPPALTPRRVLTSVNTTAGTYTVEAGDNLTRIAARFLGDGERWDELLVANADQLDRPENLRVGMTLKLPTGAAASTEARTAAAQTSTASITSSPSETTYTVQPGDNLTRIAARQLGDGDRWQELFEANADQLASPNDLFAGQTLRLP